MILSEDIYIEHYGVPGMKWGKRKASAIARNQSLNKASRQKDRANHNQRVTEGRKYITSGKFLKDPRRRKKEYRANKAEIGSREAKKILNSQREIATKKIQNAQQVKYGKELAVALTAAAGYYTYKSFRAYKAIQAIK